MASLEDLIGLIARMGEQKLQQNADIHKAKGINSYWGGTTSNETRADDYKMRQDELKK